MNKVQASLFPGARKPDRLIQRLVDVILLNLIHAGDDSSTGLSCCSDALPNKIGVSVEMLVTEPHNRPARTLKDRRSKLRSCSEFKNVVGRLRSLRCRNVSRLHDTLPDCDADPGMKHGKLPPATVFQTHERRRTDHRQCLRRLCPGPANAPTQDPKIFLDPRSAFRPVHKKLSAYPGTGSPKQFPAQCPFRRPVRSVEERRRLVQANIRIDERR